MSSAVVLALDLGGTNCRWGLVTADATILGEGRLATPRMAASSELLDFLAAVCRTGIAAERVQGIAIGVPALVDAEGKVRVAPNLPALSELPLAAELSSRLALPVTVVNDANAAAWGEFRHGSGRGLDPLLVVTLGTGVGGGLILQQRLWSGAAGTAGEIGHLPVEADGRTCGCGSRGCLETYASVSGIVRSVEESLSRGAASQLAGITGLDGATIAKAAVSGDRVALEAFELAGRMLGLALAGVVNLLSLRGVVITGGGSAGIDLLMPAIRSELQSRANSTALAQLTVQSGLLGERAALLGAAELGFAHLL